MKKHSNQPKKNREELRQERQQKKQDMLFATAANLDKTLEKPLRRKLDDISNNEEYEEYVRVNKNDPLRKNIDIKDIAGDQEEEIYDRIDHPENYEEDDTENDYEDIFYGMPPFEEYELQEEFNHDGTLKRDPHQEMKEKILEDKMENPYEDKLYQEDSKTRDARLANANEIERDRNWHADSKPYGAFPKGTPKKDWRKHNGVKVNNRAKGGTNKAERQFFQNQKKEIMDILGMN